MKHLTDIPHEVDGTAESNWEIVKSCICKAGEDIIGRERKHQPDWFLENAESLKPLIESKNQAHNQMDNSGDSRACLREILRIWLSCIDPPPSWSAIWLMPLRHLDIMTLLLILECNTSKSSILLSALTVSVMYNNNLGVLFILL